MKTYKIIRFTFGEPSKTTKRGLTLDQAQSHCKRKDTQGDGWFDGYVAEENYSEAPKQPEGHESKCPCCDCDDWAYKLIDWERSVDPKVLADYRKGGK